MMDETGLEGNVAPETGESAPASAEVPVDRMQQVGQAMIAAATAVRQGAGDARVKAQQMAPAIRQSVGKAVYATCYYLSYGVVFPTVFVASLVPMDNALGYGIIDGAAAAKEAVSAMRARRQARRAAIHLPKEVSLAASPS